MARSLSLPDHVQQRVGDHDIIVFDGLCLLCNGLFSFVLRRDRRERFRFVTAQSDLGCALYTSLGLATDPYDTFLVVLDGRLYDKTAALGALLSALGWPWRAFAWLKAMPSWSVDWAYDWIARRRYRLFGRRQTCLVPSPHIRSRFLT